MARSVEIQAASYELAVKLALEELGVSREQVSIEVLGGQMHPQPGEDEEVLVRVTETGSRAHEPRPVGTAPSQAQTLAPAPAAGEEHLAVEVLERLLAGIGVKGRVEAHPPVDAGDGDDTEAASEVLDIAGPDLGILIGRRGETLDSLEYLVNLLVTKKTGHWPRLEVDVEGYRQRRKKTLQDLARRFADRVRASREPSTFEPMPARERRIIHMTLSGDPEVMTESTGEGENRKVQVKPRA